MPWLKMNDGTAVHVRMCRSSLGRAKKCRSCSRMQARLECDGCDLALCSECGVSPFNDTRDSVDLCPSCCKPAFVEWRDNHGGASAYAVLGRPKAREEFRKWVRENAERFIKLLSPEVRVRLDRELARRTG